MKTALLLLAFVFVAAPCHASERFTSDAASPLKLVRSGKGDNPVVRFRGEARISGRFVIAWEPVGRAPRHLRVTFFPDRASAALLPHAAGAPVTELWLSNSEPAVAILLDWATAQRVLAKALIDARGRATVMIGDYASVVECDHRWYMARLISASSTDQTVTAERDVGHAGC